MASITHSDVQSASMQFSLRSLLLITSVTALLLAPVPWFGASYVASAIFSVGLIVACAVLYREGRAMPLIVAIPSVPLGLFFAVVFIVFFFHAALNLIACLLLAAIHPRPRTFAIVLSIAMAAVYGFAFLQGFTALDEIHSLQAQYPFKSIATRLAFEKASAPDTSPPLSPNNLSPHVATYLAKQEAALANCSWRADALLELHTDYQREFSRAAGFGITRMPSLRYRLVRIDREKPLTLPKPIGLAQLPSTNDELYDVHRLAANDFTSPDGIGYVKSRDAVAGFEPHQINTSWQWEHNKSVARYWQIVRLELVGLLRSAEPRVYVATNLPPMDQIADTPHRSLDDFESAALPQLTSREDIVVDQKLDRIRMLGALRAGNTCLQCHEGTRGKLLGAFSYEFAPIATAHSAAPTQPRRSDRP